MILEWKLIHMKKPTNKMRKEAKHALYVVLAALFCFAGPTYFVLVLRELISQIYAITLGLICFLIGIFLILKLAQE